MFHRRPSQSGTPNLEENPDSFTSRAALRKNDDNTKKLFSIMVEKKSMVVASLDVTTEAELLRLAEELGDYVCAVKVHVDIIEDFQPNRYAGENSTTNKLRAIAARKNFLIIADRKLADIGSTAVAQLQGGIFQIASFADMITAHGVSGPGILETSQASDATKKIGYIMVAEMSTKGNLAKGEYTKEVLEMCEGHPAVAGLVAQNTRLNDKGTLLFTPGVQFGEKKDNSDQQYNDPDAVVARGTDVIIVGRGIIAAKDPVAAVKRYQQVSWQAYLNRLMKLAKENTAGTSGPRIGSTSTT